MKHFSFSIFRLSSRLSLTDSRQLFTFALFLLLIFCFSVPGVSAQESDAVNTAPPPLKILSKDEIKQFEAITDVKKRTKLALDFMELRLKKAETLNSQEKYAEMFDELGGFHALIDKTLEFLDRNSYGTKNLSSYKRVEMTLRTFLPRLELIRRDLPSSYEFYVRVLAKSVREARSKAIDPFFGDSAVQNNDN